MTDRVIPGPLLDACDVLHVADETPLGLLALAVGKHVVCHAPVKLAGWGITNDMAGITRRGQASIGALAAGRLLGARHADPFHDRPCTPEMVLDILAEWRRVQDRKRGIASVNRHRFLEKTCSGALCSTAAMALPSSHGRRRPL